MSNKASFESRILEFFQNGPFEKVEVVAGLVKEIFKRRKAEQAEEQARVATITGNAAPKLRKKRAARKVNASPSNVDTGLDRAGVALE